MNENVSQAVESYFEGLRTRNLDGVPLAPDVEFEAPLTPAPIRGAEAVTQFLSTFLLPQIEDIQVHQHIVEGEHACTLWTLKLNGVSPLAICDYFHVVDGKLRKIRPFYDPRPITG